MPTLLSTRRVVTTTKFFHDFPGATAEWRVVSRAGIPLGPQHVRGRRRVLTLIAACGEEVRPVWIGEAIVALRQLSDLRRTVDACENTLARLLDLPQQCIDIPTHEFALPVHDLPCDQHVTYMSGVHHRHYRTWHVVHRPCVDVARVENDNIGLLARGECSDLVENAVRRGARNSGHLDDLSGGDGLRHRKTAGIALRKCEIVCQRALQTECTAHERKRIRGHVCVNVWAETGQNAVIERLLKWRHPVPHLHLDQDRDRYVSASVAADLPRLGSVLFGIPV